MVTAVIIFATITAVFEALLLLKFCSLQLLRSTLFATLVHFMAFGINLMVHWGTLTGTMTAITAALVSFAVYPSVVWVKTFWKELRHGQKRAT